MLGHVGLRYRPSAVRTPQQPNVDYHARWRYENASRSAPMLSGHAASDWAASPTSIRRRSRPVPCRARRRPEQTTMSSTMSTVSCTPPTSAAPSSPASRRRRLRVPLVATRALFDAFGAAGRELCDLHVGYETIEPYPLTEEWADEVGPGGQPGPAARGSQPDELREGIRLRHGPRHARPRPQSLALQRLPHPRRHPTRGPGLLCSARARASTG